MKCYGIHNAICMTFIFALTHKAANGVDEEDTPRASGSNSHISGGAVAAIVIVILLILAALPIAAVLVGLLVYRKKVETQATNYGMLYNHPILMHGPIPVHL